MLGEPKENLIHTHFLCNATADSSPLVMASRVLELVPDRGRVLCLAASNKAVIAGALLAAAVKGLKIVLPYALSARGLEAACNSMQADEVLTDSALDLPTGLHELRVAPGPVDGSTFEINEIQGNRTFLWLFTGGSTGMPQVWPKTVENLFGEARFLARKFGIGPGDCIVATVPANHIYGLLFSVLLPLVSGARVVNEVPYFPDEVKDTLVRHQATVLIGSPVHYRSMSVVPPVGTKLRLAFSSGGFLDMDASERFTRATGVGIVEVYGSTETGGIATRCRAFGEQVWTPFDVVDLHVDNEALCVKSPFLSPGIADRKTGFFRTGDRASMVDDKHFELLGRVDGVVKVGGRRVVLAQVRERLLALDGVTDAIVVSFDTGNGRGSGVAALVQGNVDEATIKAGLRKVLEPYQVPRLVRVVDNIPRTGVGKVDMVKAQALIGRMMQKGEQHG